MKPSTINAIIILTICCMFGGCAGLRAIHGKSLSKHYRLEKPDGAGPFPAVMLVPGCNGFDAILSRTHYDNVQNKLVGLGFVVIRVNYLAARNITACWDLPSDSPAEDISIAADFLKQQTFVKEGAINVIGWSFASAGAFSALRRTRSREPAQVDAVVVYSPYCPGARSWDSNVPVLILRGAIDNISPSTACERLFSRLKKRDRLTDRVYDDAYHGFDNPGLPAEFEHLTGTLGYNEAAAKSAWIEVKNFLIK